MSTHLLRPILFLLLLAGSTIARAQEEDDMPMLTSDRMQELKAQKAAFITQRLGLTPEEAQTFWPLYNKYDQEIEDARKRSRSNAKEAKGTPPTEAEASKILDETLASRQRELDIRKRYSGEFRKTIGAVKTLQLGRAEREFNRELLKRVRDRRTDERREERREAPARRR